MGTLLRKDLDSMKITGLIWLEDIVDKLDWKHRVQPYEVEEVFERDSLFRFVEKGHRKGENVYVALGQTFGGRYLIIFFIYKHDGRALILSARNMTRAERRNYEQS